MIGMTHQMNEILDLLVYVWVDVAFDDGTEALQDLKLADFKI